MAERRDKPKPPPGHGRAPSAERTYVDPLLAEAIHTLNDPAAGEPSRDTDRALTLPAFDEMVRPTARIEYQAADGTAHVKRLGERTAIGRHTDNDVQLLDPEVSKSHLLIMQEPSGFVLRDLGSANGTIVNGLAIDEAVLKDGDLILVGNTSLRFYVEMPYSDISDDMPPPPVGDLPEREPPEPRDPERTVVTLVPELGPDVDSTNVFAVPMREDFPPADIVRDERVLRRDYERLRVAFDLALQVGLETDLKALGQALLGRILDVLPADTAAIMILDEDGKLSTLASFAEGRGEVRIPRAIIDQVLKTREALLTSDAQLDAALRSSHTVVGQQIRSALCVPLVAGEAVYGAIHVSTSSAAGAYEERDLALLRAIAQPAALAVANARLVARVEQDARTRAQLSRFLSPALVERVVNRDVSLETAGDTVLCTVLFSDIRGFTSMSDGVAPAAVVSMLNEYFEAMVEIVFEHGGVLDKFIGDGLMAVWGTPVSSPDDAASAVRAAHQMRRALDEAVNAARAKRGDPPLKAGYGIATGRVIAGAMGGTRRQDFTVIGDTVNLASRLCGEARPGQLLVCEATERAASPQGIAFSRLEARVVKGVARPVPIFELPRAVELSPGGV